MSVRIRSLRTLFAQRSLHTTSLAANESGPPKPPTAADLGFGTANASRTRNLEMFDLGLPGGGDIGMGMKSTGPRDASRQGPRDGPRRDRSGRGPRGPPSDRGRDQVSRQRSDRGPQQRNAAPKSNDANEGDFFDRSNDAPMPPRASLAAKGQRRRIDVDASLIDFDNNVSPSSSGSRPPRREAGPRSADGASRPRRFSPRPNAGAPGTIGAAGRGGAGREAGQRGPRLGPPGARAQGGPRGPRAGAARKRPEGGRSSDLGGMEAARKIWEGAPLPMTPVDLSYKSLFGAVSALDGHLRVDWRNSIKAPWADGMTRDQAQRKQALRTAGDTSTMEPSSARPQPGQVGKKDLPRQFEWQLAFNRNLTAKHNVQLQKAVEVVTKAVA